MRPKFLRTVSPLALLSAVASSLVLFVSVQGPVYAQSTVLKPVAARLTAPIDEKSLLALPGSVHPLAISANDRGIADAGMPLERMKIVLKRSDAQEADLKQLISDLHTPGTASYHQWLTPNQFGLRFGPSDSDIATLTAWLGSHGFAVTKLSAGRQTLEFSGTAGQFSQAFHTQIHKYLVNGETHYANASNPSIPAALSPVFGGFASLNNFRLRSYAKRLGTATYDPATHKAVPNWTIGGSSGYNYVLAPGDFAVQYDLNPLYNAGIKGAGQTIAIINESNINPALVSAYRTLFNLPANPVNVILDGSDPGIDGINNPDGPNGASVEAYLDVEEAGAVAPAATIDLVVAADTALQNGLILAAEHAVDANVAPVLSLSFGGCEAAQGSFNTYISGLWQQAAAQGQTVLVSTGDAGAAGCDNDNTQQYAVYGAAVNGLGSTPYNVAVGGTDFFYSNYSNSGTLPSQLATYWGNPASNVSNTAATTSLQTPIPEQPWNDSQYGSNILNQYTLNQSTSIAGGGGGASSCATGTPATNSYSGGTCAGYPKPSWQSGTGVPADGVRDLPDVALFAANGANYTYYPVCAVDGDCQGAGSGIEQFSGIGGTSASTPAFAGLMALVNQKTNSRQGQANFVLYPMAQQFPTAFHDVTNGSNAVPCQYAAGTADTPNCLSHSPVITVKDANGNTITEGELGNVTANTPDYNAGAGYDLASGLGSVDATVLVNNWSNVKFTSSSVTLTASQTTFTHGTAITVSGTVTPGTASGSVALETTSTEPLQASQGAPSLLNGGKAVFTVTGGAYTGSVNYLPGGTYNILGAYTGDGTNAPSTSTPVSITVAAEPSSLAFQAFSQINALALSGTSIPYGSEVLLSGQPYPTSCYVAANPGTSCTNINYTVPTGLVTFSDNGATLNAATLNAEGDAEYNAGLAVGTHSLTASYAGDKSYNTSSVTTPVAFTVVKDTPDIYPGPLLTLSNSSANLSATSGQTSLTVQIVNSANDKLLNSVYETVVPVAAPTGTVTLTGLPSGTITLPVLQSAVDTTTGGGGSTGLVEGIAAIPVPAGLNGTYTVNISYSGDNNYNATSTGNFTFQIAPGSGTATTTTATTSQAATSVTSATTVTVNVTGTSSALTGTVYLFAPGGYELAAVGLPGNKSTATVSITVNSESLIEGTNVLTAQYLPAQGSPYAPSFALVTIQNGVGTVPAGPSISLTNSGAITVAPGSSGMSTITVTPAGGFTGAVALTCAVTPTTGASVPSCTVGNATVSGTTAAIATLNVSTTATTTAAGYSVTVTAMGAGVATQTTTVPLTVTGSGPAPTLALANSGAITIASPGGSGTSTITATFANLTASNVSLSCAVSPTTLNDTPTCTVGTLTAVSGSTTSATATLTVATTAASAAMERPRMKLLPIGGGVVMATLLFFVVPVRRRRWTTLLGAMILMAAVGLSTGCGGGGSVSNPGNAGTATGSYTVTVTGTATGATAATTTVTLTVN